MNFTETFNEFSTKLKPTDLALYAGIGMVLWVLFKDKLSPVQKILLDLFNKAKNEMPVVKLPTDSLKVVLPTQAKTSEDIFFKLVVSWKQTRDLAVESGCSEAVKVADQMFPYLSPTVCANPEDTKS
jgi:hypothetical protein